MAVQQNRLNLCEERIVLIDVPPARLHHRHLGIGEELHASKQEVGRGNEVGVEHRNEFTFGDVKPGLKRSGLVPGAVRAVQIRHVDAGCGVPTHGALRDDGRFIN